MRSVDDVVSVSPMFRRITRRAAVRKLARLSASAMGLALIFADTRVGAREDSVQKEMKMKHSMVPTNGITMHVVEYGKGPPVLFCHGFPDTWRGWRRQIEAVGDAGFRAIAVDMRGYGRTSAPPETSQYTPFHVVGDLVGLLDALGIGTVTIVGHDFGATAAWNAALMRPDRFTAVFGISVVFRPRGEVSFLDRLRAARRDDFYMFSQMRPEADEEWADAARTIPAALYNASGSPAPADRWSPFDPKRKLSAAAPVDLPGWADPDDVAYTIAEFQRTGFHGGLNWYRAIQLGFDLAAPFKNAKIHQPSFFLRGSVDGLKEVPGSSIETLKEALPGLRGSLELAGVGHWPQQEASAATNEALLGFLRELS